MLGRMKRSPGRSKPKTTQKIPLFDMPSMYIPRPHTSTAWKSPTPQPQTAKTNNNNDLHFRNSWRSWNGGGMLSVQQPEAATAAESRWCQGQGQGTQDQRSAIIVVFRSLLAFILTWPSGLSLPYTPPLQKKENAELIWPPWGCWNRVVPTAAVNHWALRMGLDPRSGFAGMKSDWPSTTQLPGNASSVHYILRSGRSTCYCRPTHKAITSSHGF